MGAHCGPRGHFWVVGGGAIPKNLSKGMCRLVLYVMMLDNRSKRDSRQQYCDVLQYSVAPQYSKVKWGSRFAFR